jgi:hypothetical protein
LSLLHSAGGQRGYRNVPLLLWLDTPLTASQRGRDVESRDIGSCGQTAGSLVWVLIDLRSCATSLSGNRGGLHICIAQHHLPYDSATIRPGTSHKMQFIVMRRLANALPCFVASQLPKIVQFPHTYWSQAHRKHGCPMRFVLVTPRRYKQVSAIGVLRLLVTFGHVRLQIAICTTRRSTLTYLQSTSNYLFCFIRPGTLRNA